MNATAGTILSERYTLTERIAAGGMGEVWSATDAVLDRTVAVKLLSPALSQQSGFLDRFRAEARYAAGLDHPNITTVFDYGEGDGSAYLVMELVAGQPLSQIIAEGAPLSAEATASILIQAASALQAAHQGGVIHRDVKPANILVTPDGTAKLTDFGISRLVGSASLTQTGQVLGTAQYLSPEVVTGESATASSDIYALGVVGHEMLSGHPPFHGETLLATAFAHLNQPPPPLPDTVPVGIRSVISAALAKDPADRPATAAAMAQALRMPHATSGSESSSSESSSSESASSESASSESAGSGAAADRTQVLPTRRTASRLPDTADRRSRLHPGWLIGAASALAIGVLAAFALPGGDAPSPVATTTTKTTTSPQTSPQTAQANAPVSAATPTQIASPQKSSSIPDQHKRDGDRARGHDNKKDGKQ